MLNAITKVAINAAKKQTPRLFTLLKDAKIGTEIKNNITGTIYFRSADAGKTIGNVVHYNGATAIEKSGKYHGISKNAFDELLKFVQSLNPPKNMRPMIFAGDGKHPATLVKPENIDRFLTNI